METPHPHDAAAAIPTPSKRHRLRRLLGDPKLYGSIAVALLMVCVTVAFVSVVWDRNGARNDLSATRSDLTETREELADAKRDLAQSDRETDCRARLANEVADRQAETILAIGDLAVALYLNDTFGAAKAAEQYRLFSAAYQFAVAERGDSVTKCKGS